ncbi:response regulator transcription factor [Rhizobium sp. 16-449-1b]|uniref:response regulator transcription factor n=1 Tax=Rhizobium sp. 16-449-1b TaxID=2819989 RepID=UPI001ADBFC7A|nr:response regulator transcription factor [Rhizobium sp. 16-449-1b]
MIYLVDDDLAVREAMTLLLATYGKEVTAFPDATHLLAHVEKAKPGIMLLDLRMPAISGLQLLKKLEDLGIRWPAIMITGHGDVEACRRAFKAGVVDFLAKPVDEHVLMETIAMCESALDDLLVRHENSRLLYHLTAREREVIELVSKGFGSKDIAFALDVSVRTVDSHRASIATKLGTPAVAEQTRIWLMAHR